MSEEKRTAMEIINLLSGLSVDELEILRPLWLKNLESLSEGKIAQHCANELINLVIHRKQEEAGVVQCESRN